MKDFKVNFIDFVVNSFVLRVFIQSVDVREFIACQFALESDYGRSERALEDSNICGMKVPHRRFSVRLGSNGEFATYNNWFDCINDYILWIFYNRPYQNSFDSVYSYSLFLRDSGYCPEKDYIDKINSIYQQFKSFKNEK